MIVLGREYGPIALVILLADVRAWAAEIGLDHFGQMLMDLLDVLVASHHLPRILAVRKTQRVVIGMKYVRAVFSLGFYRHVYGLMWYENKFAQRQRVHIDLQTFWICMPNLKLLFWSKF